MDTTIVICSVNRPATLHETVLGLLKQTVQPAAVLLSLCEDSSVLPETKVLPGVRCLFGPRGSSVQRNAATPFVATPYVLYLDDDVELAPDYIAQMEHAFGEDRQIVAAGGGVVADGARDGTGIDREAALRAILEYRGIRTCVPVAFDDLCGFNLFVRSRVLQKEKFDERLPLYAWLEDRDFMYRCAKHGKVVRHQGALVAHLATRSGRTSDVRLGYTKIANPWYLWRKSVVPSLAELMVRYWMKTTIANIVRAALPIQPQNANYKKRLLGNLMAYRDLMLFRIDPQNILSIPESTDTPGQVQQGEVWRSAHSRST